MTRRQSTKPPQPFFFGIAKRRTSSRCHSKGRLGTDIRKLINNFTKCSSATEAAAWASFRSVVCNFLGKKKCDDYRQIIEDLLKNYRKMGVRMSLKVYFLHSHLDFFPDNLGDIRNEEGERLHQYLQKNEKNYQSFWDERMLSDYC